MVSIPHCSFKAKSLKWLPLWEWWAEHTFACLHKGKGGAANYLDPDPQVSQWSHALDNLLQHLGWGAPGLQHLALGLLRAGGNSDGDSYMTDNMGCKLGSLVLGLPVTSPQLRPRTWLPHSLSCGGHCITPEARHQGEQKQKNMPLSFFFFPTE